MIEYTGNITKDHITIVCSNGDSGTIHTDHPGYEAALTAVRELRFDDFLMIANPVTVVHRYADGRISIADGIVTFDDEVLHTHLADRMVDMIQDGFGVEPLANFIVNLHQNPSKRAVDELYGFLEISNLTITADGYFVAYKKVREDYMDVYSRTMDNKPGAICEMERNKVDDNKDNTCSQGLHFCGRAYLNSYPGERTMVVKINPRDVVSIPSDYQNHKGRTCKYEVIGELENGRGDGGERVEALLEGSCFTGKGVKMAVKDDELMFDEADEFIEDDLPIDDLPIDDIPDDVCNFHPSRTAARNEVHDMAAQGNIKFKDFGTDAPKGKRWATVYTT